MSEKSSPSLVNDSIMQTFAEPTYLVQDFKDGTSRREEIKEENSVTILDPPEHNEENSRAFMESIGSWINDLFNASNKIPDAEVKPEKVETPKDMTLEHADYIKLLAAIKKRFQSKMKNETSVRVSSPEKPFEFNFENSRRRSKSQPCLSSSQYSDGSYNEQDDFFETLEFLEQQNNSNSGYVSAVRTGEVFEDYFTTVNSRNSLVKKKLRVKNRNEHKELREYVLPTSSDLTKKILLNVNDQYINDKGLHLLKTTHIGVQETQHYSQGKKRAYQVNARCYTTNANPKKNLENSSVRNSSKAPQYCTSQASKLKGADEILSKNSMDIKKYITNRAINPSDMPKDLVPLGKIKTPKSPPLSSAESKGDAKTPSDELVRYLMKKIKASPRSSARKKTNSNVSDALTTQMPKNKFKRSATNNLVMKIAAKNEVQTSLRNDSRAVPENKVLASKEILVKYPENLRFDVSRAVTPSKFNKCSYLPDNDKVEDDRYLLERNSKNPRRYADVFSKRNEKYKKDTIAPVPKLNMNYVVYQKHREGVPEAENYEKLELTESQAARFKKQHELFKTTFKSPEVPANLDAEVMEPKTEKPADTANVNLLPAEFTDARTTLQLSPEEKDKVLKPTTVVSPPKEPEPKTTETVTEEKEKPLNLKVEKKVPEKLFYGKNKGHRIKSSLLMKEEPKMLINSLGDFETKNQKESSRSFEPSLCSADLRAAKTAEIAVFNRRYSTNSLKEVNNKPKASANGKESSPNLPEMVEKEGKEKIKREKVAKSEVQDLVLDEPCGFQGVAEKAEVNK